MPELFLQRLGSDVNDKLQIVFDVQALMIAALGLPVLAALIPGMIGSRALAACIVCAALGACSQQQLYATGQQWQRTQCQKIDDRAQRTRCEDSVALSFDEYQVQRQDTAKR